MKHLILFSFILFFIPFYITGCDDTSSKNSSDFRFPHLVEPGKTDDIGDHINLRGRISFGGEAYGEFTEDNQLEGYIFTAKKDSIITVENSNRGTSRQLDSTLFIYGPKTAEGFYGTDPVNFDDDSGWGTHAKIADFKIPEDGEYLIVVGTYMNIDRGNYRIELDCDGDNCVIPCSDECSKDPCGDFICSETDGCIENNPDNSCGEKRIIVSKTEVITSEEPVNDSFSLSISDEPTDNIIIWVNSSNPDEAEVYPIKVLFCKPGFFEGSNGCEEDDGSHSLESPHWQRVVDISVFGVRDLKTDNDATYTINFTIETGDEDYSKLTLNPIEGMNINDESSPDYSQFENLYDNELLDALNAMISTHTAYGYLGQNSCRTLMFSTVDVHNGMVESIYTGYKIYKPRDSVHAYQMGFNTEHSWPQSQFKKLDPMVSDLHHIFSVDISTNGKRSSYDFGMTSNPDYSLSVLGSNAGEGSSTIFQVRPERRGDIARAHFYMVARYKNTMVEGKLFDDDNNPNNGCINDYEEAVLRQWNEEDPVDDLERERNNRVEGFQHNRNPFIDHPELIDQISDF